MLKMQMEAHKYTHIFKDECIILMACRTSRRLLKATHYNLHVEFTEVTATIST